MTPLSAGKAAKRYQELIGMKYGSLLWVAHGFDPELDAALSDYGNARKAFDKSEATLRASEVRIDRVLGREPSGTWR